jgi:hypothetical protein
MSLRLKILKALLGAAAVAMLATGPGALAQPATLASVLPTGGGLALIDSRTACSCCSIISPGCSRL